MVPREFPPIEALERYHHFYGDSFKVECPTGSGVWMNLQEVATELAGASRLFAGGCFGNRPCNGDDARYASDPHFKDLILFHEHFHGDNGRGLVHPTRQDGRARPDHQLSGKACPAGSRFAIGARRTGDWALVPLAESFAVLTHFSPLQLSYGRATLANDGTDW